MFSEFSNIRKSISLENAGESLSVEKPKYLHKSDDDSELTMNLVKGMCKQLDCSLEELIELCDSCSGKSENNLITYDDFEIRQQKDMKLLRVESIILLEVVIIECYYNFLME